MPDTATPMILLPDQQITTNGIYDIPIERYHNDPNLCDGPSISNSGLRAFESNPEVYWYHSPLNPNRVEPEPKTHFTFGRAAHSLVVEGKLPDNLAISPFDTFRTKEAREWRDHELALGNEVLKAEDLAAIEGMAERLAKESMIQSGLLSGLIEKSLIWKDEATGLWVRSRPDSLPTDTIFADYKTAASADPDDISRDLFAKGYAPQIALAAEGVAKVLGRVIDSYCLVVQEKKPPYTVTIAAVSDDAISYGARLNRLALDRFARALEANDWPGYSDGPCTVHTPKWLQNKFEANDNILPEVPTLKEMANG